MTRCGDWKPNQLGNNLHCYPVDHTRFCAACINLRCMNHGIQGDIRYCTRSHKLNHNYAINHKLWNLIQLLMSYYHEVRHMSCSTRKPDFCSCENKGADQLCSNSIADQHLCFHYTNSTILLLLKPHSACQYRYLTNAGVR